MVEDDELSLSPAEGSDSQMNCRYNAKVFQSLVHAFEALDRRGAWMISYADYTWAQDTLARTGSSLRHQSCVVFLCFSFTVETWKSKRKTNKWSKVGSASQRNKTTLFVTKTLDWCRCTSSSLGVKRILRKLTGQLGNEPNHLQLKIRRILHISQLKKNKLT